MIADTLKKLGIQLPEAPGKGGLYAPTKMFGGNLVYVSGCGCNVAGKESFGKLGKEYTTEEGQEWARNAILNLLAVLERDLGSLDRIRSFEKITVFVASADEFYEQPQVANGATKLLQEVFGDEVGLPTRSAIGVNVLPGNIAVEIEALVSCK
ncbi:MAG: RidA family protein [Oscillospiraceae bacterium]|nr:RidA family protein [Oscillospiraceae bacterium]MCI8720961.1 RidA family protein [Oscillospiraceae bacterium]MCI8942002.1 RidA family protein [Oscillospiraceae bacterium]